MSLYIKERRLQPLLKYPGGKERELPYIHEFLPPKINNFYEPFLGGGAVYFSLEAEEYFVNDKSDELIDFYLNVKSKNKNFMNTLQTINYHWKNISEIMETHEIKLSNYYKEYAYHDGSEEQLTKRLDNFITTNKQTFKQLLLDDLHVDKTDFLSLMKQTIVRKMKRMKTLEKRRGELPKEDIKDNIESAMKAAYYTQMRTIFNHLDTYGVGEGSSSAIYLFIRQMCYSSMFRYNKSGEFNVPYGGISYNKNNFDRFIKYFKSTELHKHLAKTTIENLDFYEFMHKYPPKENDFVFVDPPYDTDFSTYAKNQFDQFDQERLANYLIHECEGNFMLVIKNTELIASLYPIGEKTINGEEINMYSFDKTYSVSFKNRNNRDAEHLLITNYDLGE